MVDVSRETSSSEGADNPEVESTEDILSRIFGDDSSAVGFAMAQDNAKLHALKQVKFTKPSETRMIAVANQKGGVGKTTSAVNLASAFAEANLRVLLIDMDPQGNASTALGVKHMPDTPSVYDVIEGREEIIDVLQKCPDFETLDVVPSTIELSGAELEIADMQNRTNLLRDKLQSFLKSTDQIYDFVIIDCAPSLGLLVLNALCAVNEVLIPIQAEYYALEGLGQLLHTIELVQQSLNTQLIISTMLVTMFDKRTLLSKEVYDEVRKHYPHIVLNTTIPRAVRISEAPSFNQSAIAYDPRGNGSIAYREAALEISRKSEEVLRQIHKKGEES